jgi:heme-degrading monooxygenase HmoA
MYVAYVEVIDQSEDGALWLRWKQQEGALIRQQPGWIRRLLLRSSEEPRRYHYITMWETAEQAIAFSNSPPFVAAAEALGVSTQVNRLRLDRCELLLDEAATPASSPIEENPL